ncbi:hypothetical protein JRG66_11390 [Salinimicrobium tongyeongense]|jgi:hypothetical protein|uniref:LTXXQ motif family protein n=1 Tax=Salinimicrobium tongyeongense TaxID=2809707 RepID=A0ABY6NPS7_9FLAO|nr:hypothetical protein [Salinimicrobium tongyeongense]UZH54573.1 hypothetical protein JRG66_11390 [Salinimicrobium tongyeongense]
MKNIKTLRLVLSLSLIMIFSSVATAQDIMQNSNNPQMEMSAKNRVEKWEKELSLRAKQAILMEKKFVEFDIKREKLLGENLSDEQRLNRLKDLKILETRELRDILTKPQFDRYLLILREEAQATAPPQNNGN